MLLPILIAQASDYAPPAGFSGWLESAFYLLGIAAAVLVVWNQVRAKPTATEIAGQPVQVKAADAFTPLQAHLELKGRVDRIDDQIRAGFETIDHKRSVSIANVHTKVEEAIDDLRKEVKGDLGGLHERLSVVLAAVAELKGEIKARFDS